MKRKLLFLAILILIAVSYCYSHRDMFRDTDTLSFGTTPADVQKKIKVAAFITQPKKVEYKSGKWYGDGQPAIVVFDGKNNYGLTKKYEQVLFLITVDERYYTNMFSYDKPDPKDAYDIRLNIMPKDTAYTITGEAFHLGENFISFNGNRMQPFRDGLEILYP